MIFEEKVLKQIIVMGGGWFAKGNSEAKIEKYILEQAQKDKPKVCFLPQASCESREYIVKFFEVFTELGAEPSWVSLFGRVTDAWKQHLLNQDIIYVGGGNTKSMLALWKAWGVDQVLREAYEKGIILSGISAGGICWFEEGVTDSIWPLDKMDMLGFLEGSMCPHFDSEIERQPVYRHKIQIGEIKPGIALEDKTAAHFIDGKLHKVVAEIVGKKVFKIGVEREEIIEPVIL